ERDAAFLAEMGIGPLWSLRAAPEAPVETAPQPVAGPAAPVQAEAPPAAQAVPRPLAPPPMPRQVAEPAARPAWTPPPREDSAWGVDAEPGGPDVSTMDWAALRQAIASCKHCSACSAGRKPVLGAGARQARWLVAAGTASAADEKAGQPLTGEPGK